MEEKKKKLDKINDKVENINKSIDRKIAKAADKLKKGGIDIKKKENPKKKKTKSSPSTKSSSVQKVKKIDKVTPKPEVPESGK